MPKNKRQPLPYAARRMLAILKGKENIDDGGTELKTFTIYCVSRGLTIGCNENNLSYWLEHGNYIRDGKIV